MDWHLWVTRFHFSLWMSDNTPPSCAVHSRDMTWIRSVQKRWPILHSRLPNSRPFCRMDPLWISASSCMVAPPASLLVSRYILLGGMGKCLRWRVAEMMLFQLSWLVELSLAPSSWGFLQSNFAPTHHAMLASCSSMLSDLLSHLNLLREDSHPVSWTAICASTVEVPPRWRGSNGSRLEGNYMHGCAHLRHNGNFDLSCSYVVNLSVFCTLFVPSTIRLCKFRLHPPGQFASETPLRWRRVPPTLATTSRASVSPIPLSVRLEGRPGYAQAALIYAAPYVYVFQARKCAQLWRYWGDIVQQVVGCTECWYKGRRFMWNRNHKYSDLRSSRSRAVKYVETQVRYVWLQKVVWMHAYW